MKYYVAFWAYPHEGNRSQIVYAESIYKVNQIVLAAYPTAINLLVTELTV